MATKLNPDFLFSALSGVNSAIDSLTAHIADLPKDQEVLRSVATGEREKLFLVHYWLLGAIESFGFGDLNWMKK